MKNDIEINDILLKEHKVIGNEEIANNVYILEVERIFDFVPGQIVHVTINGTIIPRMYSICSGNQDKVLKILYNVKEDGLLTKELAKLRKGQKVYISCPTGSFVPNRNNSWWIASGTGIAPYISSILSYDNQNINLIHGARTIEGFYFQELLENRLGLNYVRCCSSEMNEKVYMGRLTNYIKEIDQFSLDAMFYLCGSTEMVVDTRDILISKGIQYSKIASEIYF